MLLYFAYYWNCIFLFCPCWEKQVHILYSIGYLSFVEVVVCVHIPHHTSHRTSQSEWQMSIIVTLCLDSVILLVRSKWYSWWRYIPRMHCSCSVMKFSERLGQDRFCFYHINIMLSFKDWGTRGRSLLTLTKRKTLWGENVLCSKWDEKRATPETSKQAKLLAYVGVIFLETRRYKTQYFSFLPKYSLEQEDRIVV